MKAAVLYGVPNLPSIIAALFYDKNTVHFPLMCWNTINWSQKTRQMYDPEKMVCDAHFLRLHVNDSYNYNMNSFDLSDQIWNVYQVDHWMHK